MDEVLKKRAVSKELNDLNEILGKECAKIVSCSGKTGSNRSAGNVACTRPSDVSSPRSDYITGACSYNGSGPTRSRAYNGSS